MLYPISKKTFTDYRMISCVHSFYTFRRGRPTLTHKVVNDLKDVSMLSTKKQWEYAGSIALVYKNQKYIFGEIDHVTSELKNTVSVESTWMSVLCYHTHPGIVYTGIVSDKELFATLPSNADFTAYIVGYPIIQSNVICDAHGYYVIDIIDSIEKFKSPLPEAVNKVMKDFRDRPYLREHVFGDSGCEYFCTTLNDWKSTINIELNHLLSRTFGITIKYYGYNEDPATITVNQESVDYL